MNVSRIKVKLMLININSIRGKKLDLVSFLENEQPEIIAIQETKIDKTILTCKLCPDNLDYDIYRNDRTLHGRGDGVILLVIRSLNAMPLYMYILENGSESVWAKVMSYGSPHFFGSWYKDPERPTENLQLLREQLDT